MEIDADLPPTEATIQFNAQTTPGGISLAWSARGVRGMLAGTVADVQAAIGAVVLRILGMDVAVKPDEDTARNEIR